MRIPAPLNSLNDIKCYFVEAGLEEIVGTAKISDLPRGNEHNGNSPISPQLFDLYRLHRFVLENKRLTILEFGTGWSTKIFADALYKHQKLAKSAIINLRKDNLFQLHVVDDQQEFIDISASRIDKDMSHNVHFYQEKVLMTTFNGRIATEYKSLPNINPDLIYIDGPDQFSSIGSINGWSTRTSDMMPMSADVLKIEHFLVPGTIIIIDGRAANARFIKANFQRNWTYNYDDQFDQHYFCLDEDPLGRYNNAQLNYYNS